jgi:hypothetical protein
MSAQVVLGKAVFTIRDADHLHVDGELVEIQRSSPTGYETVAVAGEDLLVTIEPADCAKVELEAKDQPEARARVEKAPVPDLWPPVGCPLD